jgi:hypothetical protein
MRHIQSFQHDDPHLSANLSTYEDERLWIIEIRHGACQRIHGLYPSLASAHLILSALGYRAKEHN